MNLFLTGAGFTANYGSPVASILYEAIFNHVNFQNNFPFKTLFTKECNIEKSNYEEIYQKIIDDPDIRTEDKAQISDILLEVFSERVDFYCRYPEWNKEELDYFIHFFQRFINTNAKSIFFTLNQDLFIERQLEGLFKSYNSSSKRNRVLKRPGVRGDNLLLQGGPYHKEWHISINDENSTNAKQEFSQWEHDEKEYCFYVKLHGSMDFQDNNGYAILITGENKLESISKYELIKYYHEIFEKILYKNICRIIIVGYGFNDLHINEKLIESLNKNNHELLIVSNQSLKNFYEELHRPHRKINKSSRKLLLKHLKGYLSTGLKYPEFEMAVKRLMPDFDDNH